MIPRSIVVFICAATLTMCVREPVFAQNTGALLPDVLPVFPNASGSGVNANGFVCTEVSGTNTALLTYQDSALTLANQDPIRLNAAGRASNMGAEVSIFLQPQSYRIVIFAPGTTNSCNGVSVGATIRTVDNVYDLAQIFAPFGSVNCNNQSGANAGAKFTACVAALPAIGGIADMTQVACPQIFATDVFSGVTKNVEVYIPACTLQFQATMTIPANVTFHHDTGVTYNVAVGTTLTMNSTINGVYPTVTGTGTFNYKPGSYTFGNAGIIGSVPEARVGTYFAPTVTSNVGVNPTGQYAYGLRNIPTLIASTGGTNLVGTENQPVFTTGTGVTGSIYMAGYDSFQLLGTGTGKTTTAVGRFIDTPSNSGLGTINLLGLWINPYTNSGCSICRAIETEDGDHYFKGPVTVANAAVAAFKANIYSDIAGTSTVVPQLALFNGNASTVAGIIEFQSSRSDGAGFNQGPISWSLQTNSASSRNIASISGWTNGASGSFRGGEIHFATKTDAATGQAVDRVVVNDVSTFIGGTLTVGSIGSSAASTVLTITGSSGSTTIISATHTGAGGDAPLQIKTNSQLITLTGSALATPSIVSIGTNPALTGGLRLQSGNNNQIDARNNANANDIFLLGTDASNNVLVGDTTQSAQMQLRSLTGVTVAAGASGFTIMTIGTAGGLGGMLVGTSGTVPSTGQINVTSNVFLNMAPYTNPDFGLEHWATGNIVKFASNPGAANYHGLMPLGDVEAFARQHMYLPQLDYFHSHDRPAGMKERDDVNLLLHEETFIHLFELDARIKALEAK